MARLILRRTHHSSLSGARTGVTCAYVERDGMMIRTGVTCACVERDGMMIRSSPACSSQLLRAKIQCGENRMTHPIPRRSTTMTDRIYGVSLPSSTRHLPRCLCTHNHVVAMPSHIAVSTHPAHISGVTHCAGEVCISYARPIVHTRRVFTARGNRIRIFSCLNPTRARTSLSLVVRKVLQDSDDK